MLALTRKRKMNNSRKDKFRKWLRKRLKCASSEGTRYWITRLGRKQDQQYHELRNELDQLRQKLASEIENIKSGDW